MSFHVLIKEMYITLKFPSLFDDSLAWMLRFFNLRLMVVLGTQRCMLAF